LTSGRPAEETKAAEALIRYRVNLQKYRGKLSDPAFSIDQIPNQSVLVLQGGGAMGAFEAGVVQALEENEIVPDIVAGVSIGAYNGAIIAGNPTQASAALRAFWEELSVTSTPWTGYDIHDSFFSSWYSFAFGSPKMFRPRWLSPTLLYDTSPASWTSFYDTSPAKSLLKRYVDFEALGKSPIRLLVTAIDVESGDLEVFDSYSHTLTPDHIVASGSIPPSFPWTTIGGRHYWDGGLASNSPLDQVAARCGLTGKQVFIVDLYTSKRALPANIMQVLLRRDELIYAERINRDIRMNELIADFHDLVDEIVALMQPDATALVKQRPRYAQLMGSMAPYSITRIIREGKQNEAPSRDSDFSLRAIIANREEGYQQAKVGIAARRA
jgi:NTE family protein